MAKAKTKTQRVIEMVNQGKTVKEIVRAAKVSPQLVYTVKSRLRKQGQETKPIEPKPPLSSEGIAGLRPVHNVAQPAQSPIYVPFWKKLWRALWK